MFGKPDTEEWQIHFLQGLPGLGYERAKAIRDYYGGLPFALVGDLSKVEGIGKKTAERIEKMICTVKEPPPMAPRVRRRK